MTKSHGSILLAIFVWMATCELQGCGGGGSSAAPPPPPQLATSKIGGSGTLAAYSITVPCSLLNGANPSPNGMPIAWSLTAGSAPMDFTITSTVPWLTLSPTSGTLLLGGSTLITVSSIDTSQMPLAKNIVGFVASAPGYQDNKFLGLEIAFQGQTSNGTKLCEVAYTANPSTFPLP
jgi:hypothetical protein